MSSLKHYASPYYDPEYAHRYYEEHKHLKGRERSASKLSDEGKEIWNVTKENIKQAKTSEVEGEKSNRESSIQSARDKAAATKESISNTLNQLKQALSVKTKSQQESISSQAESQIKQIQNSSSLTSYQKKQKIAQIRADAKSDKANISADAKQEQQSYGDDASQQRASCAAELKAACNAAREAFKSAKEGLDTKYEDIYQSEYDKILAEYPHVNKGKSCKKGSKKGSKKSKLGSGRSARVQALLDAKKNK